MPHLSSFMNLCTYALCHQGHLKFHISIHLLDPNLLNSSTLIFRDVINKSIKHLIQMRKDNLPQDNLFHLLKNCHTKLILLDYDM